MNFLNDNGTLRAATENIHPADSAAALFGDGLFETMRCVHGRLPLWDAHWCRLREGMQALLLSPMPEWNSHFFLEEILRTVQAGGWRDGRRVRLQVYAASAGAARYLIASGPMPALGESLTLGISTKAVKDPGRCSHLKTCNALPYRIAAREAAAAGWGEAALLNSDNLIVETTKSNILLSQGGIVFVNSPADGCIAGVMRAQLLKWMQEWSLPVTKSSFTLDSLYAADEIFLTNALRGVMPVRRLFSHKGFGERRLPTDFGTRLAGMVEQKFIASVR